MKYPTILANIVNRTKGFFSGNRQSGQEQKLTEVFDTVGLSYEIAPTSPKDRHGTVSSIRQAVRDQSFIKVNLAADSGYSTLKFVWF